MDCKWQFTVTLILSLFLPVKWKKLDYMLLTSSKCQNFQRAITLEKLDGISSKFNQVLYSASPISWPSLKLLTQIHSFRDLADKFKMSKFSKGHNSGKISRIHSKVNQITFSSSSISWPSFKPLAQIFFEISCWQDFILIFSKGHNSRKGDNSDKKKKKYGSAVRNPYMKFQNPSMHGS